VHYSLYHELQGYLILRLVTKWTVTNAGFRFLRLSTVHHCGGLLYILHNRRVQVLRLRPSVRSVLLRCCCRVDLGTCAEEDLLFKGRAEAISVCHLALGPLSGLEAEVLCDEQLDPVS
jgi:hypothetical protein